jgi:hypothetical protein
MNKCFPRQLLNSLWGYEYFGDSRTVIKILSAFAPKLDEFALDAWISGQFVRRV